MLHIHVQISILILMIFLMHLPGLENKRLKTLIMKKVTSYYVHYPPVVKRVVVANLALCMATCMLTNGCYYIIISKEKETSRLCDITSVWEESSLFFSDEEDHNWEVYTIY